MKCGLASVNVIQCNVDEIDSMISLSWYKINLIWLDNEIHFIIYQRNCLVVKVDFYTV